ncbi:non-ribosomal peptide synthetase [Sandaracinus amylolyticus]|nr:non-ribosomal peptide synthetase [Sandaracinus amylolyticus]
MTSNTYASDACGPMLTRDPDILETYPLAPMQGGMLVEARLSRGRMVDVQQLVVRAPRFDDEQLLRAWQCVADRHAALRTSFALDGHEPRQVVHPRFEVRLDRPRIEGDVERGLAALLDEDRRAGLDLSRPAWRLALVDLGADEQALIWTFHHILLDGRSSRAVIEEVFARYDASARGETITLPEPTPFRAHVDALAQLDAAAAEAYFRALLDGLREPAALPWLAPAPTGRTETPRHVEVEARLPAALVAALDAIGRPRGLTLNTLVQGALAVVLARGARTSDVVIGSTRACRHLVPGGEQIVGCLINTVPVRATVTPELAALDYFAEIRRQHLEVRPFEHTPLALVQTFSQIPRGRPLCEVIVVFETSLLGTALRALGGAWRERDCRLHEQGSGPITLACYLDGDLVMRLEHDPERVQREHAEAILRYLVTLLRSFAERPSAALGELAMIPADEVRALASRGAPAFPIAPDRDGYGAVLRRVVSERGASLAIEAAGRTLSYAELDEISDLFASGLAALGATRGAKIALALPRSLDLFIAQLGALKAGVAFVPLDLRRPAASLVDVIEDAKVAMVIAAGERAPFDADVPTMRVADVLARGQAGVAPEPPSGEDVAYSLYTSGSTGKPKGVLVPHRALLAHDRAVMREYELGPDDRALQFASPAFDVALEEVYPTWLAGACVVLRSDAASESLDVFLDEIARERITVLNLPTAFFHELVHRMERDGTRLPAHVRLVVIGGEKVSARAFDTFRSLPGAPRLLNAYGPTEATISCTVYDPERDPRPMGSEIPIGRPLASARAYVLGPQREIVPDGAIGELFIGGPTVALGYHARAELDASRFVPDPFAGSGTMYATGDLARIDARGVIEFFGRADHQVKIRGFRIELGEIESALRALPTVRDAIVRARRIGDADRIVAWVVPRSSTSADALRAALADRLPEYMVPKSFVLLDALPIASGGKIDERALPEPELVTASEAPSAGPRDALDRTLLALFEDALGVRGIGIQDRFYDLGGHSLLALRLADAISRKTGHTIELGALLQAQCVAALADAMRRGEVRSVAPSLIPIQTTGSRPAIFGVHVLGAGCSYYRALAQRLGPAQPIYGLSAQFAMPPGRKPSVEEYARLYVEDLRRFQPRGPYFLLAVSLGGLTALEMARLLVDAGEEVAMVGMLDAIGPMPVEWVSPVERARRHVEKLLEGGTEYVREKILARVERERSAMRSRMLRWRRAAGVPLQDEDAHLQAALENIELALEFKPKPYEGDIVVFRATEDVYYTPRFHHEARLGWRDAVFGAVQIVDVPGDHLTLLQEPNVCAVAEEVRWRIDAWIAQQGDRDRRSGVITRPQLGSDEAPSEERLASVSSGPLR